MKPFIIFRLIRTIEHYWTTCGWSDRAMNARKYHTHAEAEEAYRRMTRRGIRCMIGQR